MRRILTSILAAVLALAPVDSFACTTAVISARASATGRPMLWKQRDTSGEFNYMDFFEGGKYRFTGVVASTDTLRESVWGGVNEVGFAIMNSQSYGLSPRRGVDRPYEGMIMKAALANCATVDEFEKYIANLSKPNGLEANFGVIDATGAAAYFEVHDYALVKFDVNDSAEGYLVRSNWSVTGRKGEGRGYDRSERAEKAMASVGTGFSPLWIWETLSCDGLICRATSVSSIVIEGVNPGDRKDSSLIWCDPGYPRCSYPVACWVAAGDDIPAVLRSARGKGWYSPANELADDLKYLVRDPAEKDYAERILGAAASAAREEYDRGTKVDAIFRASGIDRDVLAEYNSMTADTFDRFVKKTER